MNDWFKEYKQQKTLVELLWVGMLKLPYNCTKDDVHKLMDKYIEKLDEFIEEEE